MPAPSVGDAPVDISPASLRATSTNLASICNEHHVNKKTQGSISIMHVRSQALQRIVSCLISEHGSHQNQNVTSMCCSLLRPCLLFCAVFVWKHKSYDPQMSDQSCHPQHKHPTQRQLKRNQQNCCSLK